MHNIMAGLTYEDITICLSLGIAIALIYHFLLWQTIIHLPRVTHKKTLLFLSSVSRIFLLIFTALYFSYENPGRFLLIFIGFIITRLIVLKFVKKELPSGGKSRV